MAAGLPRVRVLAGGLDAWVAAHEAAGARRAGAQPEEELRPAPAL